MSEKKNGNTSGQKLFKLFLFLVLLYMFFRVVPSPLSKNKRTIAIKEELYTDKISTDAVIIKNETVYTASNKGTIEIEVEEGKRVAAGSKIVTLISSSESSNIEKELKQINNSIEELKIAKESTENLLGGDQDINLVIDDVKSDIQKSIKENRLEDIYLQKERLNNLRSISLEGVLESEDTIAKLEARKIELSEQLNRNIKTYYSEFGGIVSFNIDGEEEEYKAFDFERYNYDDIDIKVEKDNIDSNLDVEINQPIFKIIDNFSWYLAIKIDDISSINDIMDRRFLNVRLNNSDEILQGRLLMVNELKNKGVIILELTDNFYKYYDLRFPKLDIIKSNVRGFKIPKESTIEVEGEIGVYVKDLKNIIRFRPIKILDEDQKHYYVKKGDDLGKIVVEEGISIKTITEFDELFINPNGLKEGKIVK